MGRCILNNFFNPLNFEPFDMQIRKNISTADLIQLLNNYIVIPKDLPCADEIQSILDSYSKKQIIAFIGRAGSGKDYQSSLLEKRGFVKLAFADILRKITADVCRIKYEDMMDIYDDFKDGDIFPNYTGREVLENIGSAIRKFDDLFWVNSVLNQIKQHDYKRVCISDMRYANEYKTLSSFCNKNGYEFKCIFCDYHSDRYQETNKHESAKLSNWLVLKGFKDLFEVDESVIDEYLRQNR